MGLLSALFGNKTKKIAEYMERDAIIIDVRTPGEFKNGHIQGSVNVPLNKLGKSIDKIRKKGKPVITCCASGMRSANGASLLKRSGIDAMNGGAWSSLQNKI